MERGRGKAVLKFPASEEMLPLSSSSQSRVSPCEVYTPMMRFIGGRWKNGAFVRCPLPAVRDVQQKQGAGRRPAVPASLSSDPLAVFLCCSWFLAFVTLNICQFSARLSDSDKSNTPALLLKGPRLRFHI